jgi:hypothetical protein
VVELPYEADVEQLHDFFIDEILPLNRLLLGPLLDQSGVRVDLQMVLNHLPRDPTHLQWLPGKHIDISPKECDENKLLFVVLITQDTGSLTNFGSDLDGLYWDTPLGRGSHVGCRGRAVLVRVRWCEVLAPRLYISLVSRCQSRASPARRPLRHGLPDHEDTIGGWHL